MIPRPTAEELIELARGEEKPSICEKCQRDCKKERMVWCDQFMPEGF